ncbi:phage virion morphogenesis protein [Sphingomonas aerolata]|uniref:phage virion morphogenesis protein n=1 Tax=Sphingomonas aerolata TaxID=185951 RepID=UPI0035A58C69
MTDLEPIEQLCRDLLLRTAAPERVRLMRSIGREIRKSQSDRIAAQRDPDGAAFAPRLSKPDRGNKKDGFASRRCSANSGWRRA